MPHLKMAIFLADWFNFNGHLIHSLSSISDRQAYKLTLSGKRLYINSFQTEPEYLGQATSTVQDGARGNLNYVTA